MKTGKAPVALITGGTRGIGFGIAVELAKEGIDLALSGMRSEDQLGETFEELRSQGGRVIYCRGDVGDPGDRTSVMQKVKEEYGRLNFLVNNAGVAPKQRRDLLEATEESFEYVLKTNLQGPYFLSQQAARWMVEQKAADEGFSGAIINISSISATVASVNRGEYCVSKAGMAMMTSLFAARLGEYDLPVYEIRPGVIATDMTSAVKDKYDRLFREGLAAQSRWGKPSDIGKIVRSITTGSMPYSTGAVIMADGGLTIPRL
jgi:3-oxoacyl-[acyl-carrier protein] reductase